MSTENKAEGLNELLSNHDLLLGFPEEYIAQLEEFATLHYVQEGDYIARAGESANCCYLIHSGRIALELYHPTRGAIRLETLGPNKILGWSWLAPPFMWHFDARTVEESQVIALDGPRLLEAIEEDHDLGYYLLKRFTHVFADRLHHTRLQLLDNVVPH
jgi:CRP-like cAMP-binding protein